MEMLKMNGRLGVTTLSLCIMIVLSLVSIASSEEAVSPKTLFNHWQAIELAATANTAKWQIHTRDLDKDKCDFSTLNNNLNFESQWENRSVKRGKIELFHPDVSFHRLTISKKGIILLSAWDVCLPVGQEPIIFQLKERIPQ